MTADVRRDNALTMDQPRTSAALGTEPIRTIGREELKAKVDRGDDFKLIMSFFFNDNATNQI